MAHAKAVARPRPRPLAVWPSVYSEGKAHSALIRFRALSGNLSLLFLPKKEGPALLRAGGGEGLDGKREGETEID